jgi:hypothetical protein
MAETETYLKTEACEIDVEVQYRAVILKSFDDPRKTVEMRSEWLYRKEQAKEIVKDFEPFGDGWGEVFDGYVERKVQHE